MIHAIRDTTVSRGYEKISAARKKEYRTQFEDLVSNAENKSERLYPPIVAGDFNMNVGGVLSYYPAYQIAGYADREVMRVLAGKQDKYPSKYTPHASFMVVPKDEAAPSNDSSCGNAEELWSDHCGVFVQFSPVPHQE